MFRQKHEFSLFLHLIFIGVAKSSILPHSCFLYHMRCQKLGSSSFTSLAAFSRQHAAILAPASPAPSKKCLFCLSDLTTLTYFVFDSSLTGSSCGICPYLTSAGSKPKFALVVASRHMVFRFHMLLIYQPKNSSVIRLSKS